MNTVFDLEQELDQHQTIVVDSSFEFRDIVSWESAISEVVTDAATILIPRKNDLVRSTFLSLPKPLVIAKKIYIPPRTMKMISSSDRTPRSMILIRDDWTCQYCGKFGNTIDHIIPRSRFEVKAEANTWGNLCAACISCNNTKANHTPEEIGWKTPVIPSTFRSKRNQRIQSAIYQRLEDMMNEDVSTEEAILL